MMDVLSPDTMISLGSVVAVIVAVITMVKSQLGLAGEIKLVKKDTEAIAGQMGIVFDDHNEKLSDLFERTGRTEQRVAHIEGKMNHG